MKRGDLVWLWFDTGTFGHQVLYGRVIAAGPMAYRVLWESGLTNRVRQGDHNVKPVGPRYIRDAEDAMAKRPAPQPDGGK